MNGNSHRKTRPEWIAVKAFAVTILIGVLLLVPPFSSSEGRWTHPVTALFTATSATCVTGLIVVDTGSYFSLFGQLVILCLIQLGGLGIMTMGTFLLILVGRRLTMHDEFVLIDSIGAPKVKGLKSLLVRTVLFALVFEAVGAVIIARQLIRRGYSSGKGIYYGIFHSISAFCNAGFSLYKDSLSGLKSDTTLILTIAALIVIGGLGFLVLYNLSSLRPWKGDRLKRGRLSLHTRIVLTATVFIIGMAWVVFIALEWNYTLSDLPFTQKITTALFQAVTPRTAGFNVVATAQLRPATLFMTMISMFIGGSPGSTAGGIKTTTAVVIALTVVAMIRGREETELYGRSISMRVVREAISIAILGVLCIAFFFGILLISEQSALSAQSTAVLSSQDLLFETVSAAATVGLSTGVTPHLSMAGRLAVIACMFIGRLGPLTIAVMIGRKEFAQAIRYPEQEVVVG